MNWYILAKRPLTPKEKFMIAASNVADNIGYMTKILNKGDALGGADSFGIGRGAGYDPAPSMTILPAEKYPAEDDVQFYIENHLEDKTVFVTQADKNSDAIQSAYFAHFLFAGERSYLFQRYPDAPKCDHTIEP